MMRLDIKEKRRHHRHRLLSADAACIVSLRLYATQTNETTAIGMSKSSISLFLSPSAHLLHELVNLRQERQFSKLLTSEAHVPGMIVWVPRKRFWRMDGLILNL